MEQYNTTISERVDDETDTIVRNNKQNRVAYQQAYGGIPDAQGIHHQHINI